MDITKGNINDELIGNYFNFKMPVLYPENDENGKLHNVYGPVGAFALPFEEDINGSETQKFYKGRMYFSAGKSFVEKDLVNRCYLSWANYANNIINASDFNTLQIQALSDYYDKQDLTKNPSTKFSNLLYYNSDDSKSQIFWKEDLGHFISFEQDETTNKYLFLRHAYIKGNGSNPPETPHNGFFGLINTCMRFKEKKIISQYEYIDFNIYFDKDISINLLSKNYQINRFNRFFKFIYEIGISNSKFTEIEQIFNIHAVNLPISSDVLPQYDKNTVCLIEISNKIKDILVKDKANTLVIYLYKLGLLDIDESENSSSSYPFYPGNFNFNTRFSTIESNFYQKENDYFKHSKAISHPSGFITSGVIIDGKIKHNYDLSRFFITTFVDSQIIYPRTTPHQFLENSIIIKDLMPLLMKSNILLPINCPIMNTFKNDGGRQATIYNPSITIATTKGNSYSNISTSLNFITKKIDANKVPISTWGFDLDFLEKILHISTLKGIDSLSEVPIYTTLKFESYVSKIDNLLYVSPWIGTQYNSGNPGANPKYKFNCSAFIFFLNIDTQKNLTLDLRSTKIKGEILDSNFYLDKKNLKK